MQSSFSNLPELRWSFISTIRRIHPLKFTHKEPLPVHCSVTLVLWSELYHLSNLTILKYLPELPKMSDRNGSTCSNNPTILPMMRDEPTMFNSNNFSIKTARTDANEEVPKLACAADLTGRIKRWSSRVAAVSNQDQNVEKKICSLERPQAVDEDLSGREVNRP